MRHVSSLRLVTIGIIGSKAWSGIGHDTLGIIARSLIAPSTDVFVATTLQVSEPKDRHAAMIDAGRWPDQVPDDMDWSRNLHFASLPTRQCTGFDFNRDCSRCIVGAIANYTMRAINPNLDVSERKDALRFVIHFMGDIHIPMHVGFKGDSGGNAIAIAGVESKYPVNLHNVWDYHLLQLFDRHALTSSVKLPQSDSLLGALTPEDIEYDTILELAADIADETSRLACTNAYKHTVSNIWIESGDTLEDAYWEANSKIASDQLKLAGIRLAKLLDLMATASPTSFEGTTKSAYSNVITAGFVLFTLIAT